VHFGEGIRLGLLQLRQEKLKSAFSLLGVTIGVMFLVLVVSVVEGVDRYITEDFADQVYGVNTVQIRRSPPVQVATSPGQQRDFQRRPWPTPAEADRVRQALTVPARVGVESNLSGDVRNAEGTGVESVRITAISEDILEIRTLRVEEGRPFSSQEVARGVSVVILGQSVAEALFAEGSAVGQRVRIRGFPFRVVGVLEEQGTLFGMTLDNRALVPTTSPIVRFLPERNMVHTIAVQTLDPADLRTAVSEAEAAIRVARGLRPGDPNNFEVETAEESLAFWDQISTALFVALPGLVGISLVVGGIVIMNIMLMSVMERTREIGVRMAIGARRRDIVGQFLVEASTLAGIGAVIGVGVGIGLTWIVAAVSPLPAAVTPHWVAVGLILGPLVGIVAGVYPAVQASKLDPVEALRYE
jgi:putative ABC transport system permease protein